MDASHTHDAVTDDQTSTSTVLLVPMRIDALCAPTGSTAVREAFADYSKLPYMYSDSRGNWHPSPAYSVPNLSDAILSLPCPGASMKVLDAGIHLHWALPEALTHSVDQDKNGAPLFPVVPNRWLVTRRRDQNIEKQWVVESDYLAPDMTSPQPPDSTAVPFPFVEFAGDSPPPPFQPFRFMGQKVDLSRTKWSPSDPKGPDYLGNYDGLALTATGVMESVPTLDHVKATFAAFYPNCQGVFGLHDDDSSVLDNLSGVTYDILGWYADPAQDCTGAFVAAYTPPGSAQLQADFEERFEWTFDLGNAAFPQRTVLYGRITFQNGVQENPAATDHPITLAIGNSPTQALSAYLARSMADADNNKDANQTTYEEQLEALQVADRLNQRAVDLGAAFEESRHTNGFTPAPGGILWSVQKADPTASDPEPTLPDDLAHGLNALNALQKTYDGALDTIVSLGERLFSDFCAWMAVYYDDSTNQQNYPGLLHTPDKLEALYGVVDQGGVAPLRKKIRDVGRLVLQVDPSSGKVTATASEVVIRLVCDEDEFFDDVTQDLDSEQLQDDTDEDGNYKSIAAHFNDCGIDVSSGATVKGTSPQWTVTKNGVSYTIQQIKLPGSLRQALELHIPASDDQTASHLASALSNFSQELATKAPQYVLRATAAPRYWQPNDPVVLMIGDSVVATDRFGTDGSLECALLPGAPVADTDLLDLPGDSNGILTRIREEVDTLAKAPGAAGFASWTEQPWNPFMLEWNVQYFPIKGSPTKENDETYDPSFITQSYQLSANGCDLSPQGTVQFLTDAQEYSGFSVLTPHAGDAMRHALAAYLARAYESLPEPYSDQIAVLSVDDAESYLDRCISDLQAAYDSAHQPADPKDPILTAIRAYALITDKDKPCLSQALGGFNDALLAMERTMQLDVFDPFSQDPQYDSQLLAAEVSGLVEDTLLRARQPSNVFSPIRSGKLKITGLHLVDSFGRVNNLTFNGATMGTEVMPQQNDGSFLLPPRLSQPARVLFRWLSATPVGGYDDQEMNAHPATSPICGWVLPNNLDNSLMFYEASGGMLGLVDEAGVWMPAPGSTDPVAVGDIQNPHLQQLVKYLTSAGDEGADFMSKFLSAVNNALETIDPETFAQHEGLALLMGRPLALVRAALSLEVQGLPARDNSWDVIAGTVGQYQADKNKFDKITDTNDRFTNAFDKVVFPVRIGEPGQLNDGLVGYWAEGDGGNYVDGTFYAPGGGDAGYSGGDGPSVVTTPTNLPQSIDAPASIVTMLVDPRGVVHATSGILPSKAVSIPSDQYADALKNIDITFLVAPVLATGTEYSAPDGSRKVPMPLPKEPSYTWSWLSQRQRAWAETTQLSAVDTAAKFPGQQWICEGWLKLEASK